MVIFEKSANHLGSIYGGVNVALDELEKSSSRLYEIISGDDEFLLWRVNTMKATQAPCSSCVRQTTHDVLFEIEQRDVDEMEIIDGYELLRCRGCSTISMAHHSRLGESAEHKYYPSPVSRKEPDWVLYLVLGDKKELELAGLLGEIYQAVYGGQYRLASMGLRALLEQVMILKVGDLPTFDQKLDAFQEQGYVSLIQRDAMRATLDVGDAAMHRAFKPTEEDLKIALDVVEGIFAPIFGHKEAAENLADRVPPRAPRPSKQ